MKKKKIIILSIIIIFFGSLVANIYFLGGRYLRNREQQVCQECNNNLLQAIVSQASSGKVITLNIFGENYLIQKFVPQE